MTEPKTLVLVPGKKGKRIKFLIFEVNVEELTAFLPADEIKSTDNFYAAQTYLEGYLQNQQGELPV